MGTRPSQAWEAGIRGGHAAGPAGGPAPAQPDAPTGTQTEAPGEELQAAIDLVHGEPSFGNTDQALRALQATLDGAPDNPLAMAAMAATLAIRAQHGWEDAVPAYTKAREMAEKALEADPNLALAHAALGRVRLVKRGRTSDTSDRPTPALRLFGAF